jgi:hypothetical protein
MSAFASNTETTTSCVGAIGVNPVRTRNVARAESSASTTADGANQDVHERGGRGNGAEIVGSSLALDSAMCPVNVPADRQLPLMPCDNTGAKM